MSASKRQGIIAIGVCCILVSVLLVFYGISQPKVNETPLSQSQDTLSQTSIKTSSSDKNDASFKNSGADTQTTVLNTKSSQPSSAQSVSYPVNLNTCTYEDLVSNRSFIKISSAIHYCIVGVDYFEGPPVPIPNTVVKLKRAENTRRAASRKNR